MNEPQQMQGPMTQEVLPDTAIGDGATEESPFPQAELNGCQVVLLWVLVTVALVVAGIYLWKAATP